MKMNNSTNIEKQIGFPLYLCSKEVIRRYTPLLEELDLTYTQYVVMLFFWEKKTSNVKQLGNTMLLDSSTLTPLLKKLEQKEYIKRKRSKDDERNLVLTITEKGEALKEKAINIPSKVADIVKLSKEDTMKLQELLYKILSNLEGEEK
jgi:DNA-binding MarR family transcriptional regulator